MRIFKYIDQDGEHTITDKEIIEQYYPYWQMGMKRIGKVDQISEEGCIEDFIVVHWASEVKD